MSAPILSVRDLHVSYGPIRALRGLDLTVQAGETVAIVGANGAGKTTLMRAISGLLPMAQGTIHFLDHAVANTPTHALAQAGMLHVPEGRGTLQRMLVDENLRLAWEIRASETSFEAALNDVYQRFPRLQERRHQMAGNLSGGEQQMLAIARALMNRPQLLLLDEPSMGLSPLYRQEVFRILADLRNTGLGILLVEQNVRSALRLAHRAHVLSQGVFTASGKASDLANDPAVLAGYLGHGKLTTET